MNISKKVIEPWLAATGLTAILLASPAEAQQPMGKILIVLSSESELPLKDGKTYRTGYYLNELIVPAQKLSEAGYELVFADPKGNAPAVDAGSISADYFAGSKSELEAAQNFQATLAGLSHPLTLEQVSKSDLGQYKAIFVPGGPAPMIDLMASPDLGSILGYFHQHRKTTVLLCHGPIALLAATTNPVATQAALRAGHAGEARALASNWPYKGYGMTIFSDEEEGIAAKNVFHAEPLFFPQQALTIAGGEVSTATAWHPKVVQDRELITGQNPGSDAVLMDVVLPTLSAQK
jgi:putative intracellular protease/amidase